MHFKFNKSEGLFTQTSQTNECTGICTGDDELICSYLYWLWLVNPRASMFIVVIQFNVFK